MLPSVHSTVDMPTCGFARQGDAATGMCAQQAGPSVYATCQPLVGSLITAPLAALVCAGAAGRPISVRYMPATNGQREYRHQDREAVEDPAVASLMQWGWPPAACVEALARLRGSPEDAHQDLFGRLTGGVLQEASLAPLCTSKR